MANKENIQKWVDALRSGEYKKTKHALRKFNFFCCLGVACDISGVGNWKGADYVCPSGSSWSILPFDVSEWLGISEQCPEVEGKELATWNDDYDRDFDEIADLIERHYLEDPARA